MGDGGNELDFIGMRMYLSIEEGGCGLFNIEQDNTLTTQSHRVWSIYRVNISLQQYNQQTSIELWKL